jgi:hypothetical protein
VNIEYRDIEDNVFPAGVLRVFALLERCRKMGRARKLSDVNQALRDEVRQRWRDFAEQDALGTGPLDFPEGNDPGIAFCLILHACRMNALPNFTRTRGAVLADSFFSNSLQSDTDEQLMVIEVRFQPCFFKFSYFD